jgi:cell wall-associated NlpC family hydrolase
VKRKLRFVFVIAMTIAISTVVVRATEEQEETFGDKLKKLFVRPTPTPKPRKKKKTSPTPTVTPAVSVSENEAPTSSPSDTPLPSITPSPSANATATAEPSETPPPAPSAAETRSPTRSREGQTQYFEAVRPISPGPRSRRYSTPKTTPIPVVTMTPTPIETPVKTPTPTETPVSRPMPSLPPMIKSSPSATARKAGTANTTISVTEISDAKSYSPEVKKVIDLGLNLTTQNLGYKYASADPAKGGMDCSGFIYYVLSNSGIKDVPRDAREQYIWVRKAGNFQAVLAQRDDGFELDALKPGDLLFWASSYGVSRDPDITQTMIYLGREKGTNRRIMIGAGERLAYKGQSRSGVNVFDFKVERAKAKSNNEPGPVFVGYGRVPGLNSR